MGTATIDLAQIFKKTLTAQHARSFIIRGNTLGFTLPSHILNRFFSFTLHTSPITHSSSRLSLLSSFNHFRLSFSSIFSTNDDFFTGRRRWNSCLAIVVWNLNLHFLSPLLRLFSISKLFLLFCFFILFYCILVLEWSFLPPPIT